MKLKFPVSKRYLLAIAMIFTLESASAEVQMTQIGTIQQYTSSSFAGTWFFNTASGRASYCQASSTASGSPRGECAVIGSTGTSAAGYQIHLGGTVLWVTSKTSGAIFQCSFTLLNGTTPRGGCAQVSTLVTLQ